MTMTGAVSRNGIFGRDQQSGSLSLAGDAIRPGSRFFRPVGEGDMDLHGAISRAALQFARTVTGALTFVGTAFVERFFLVGTLTWKFVSAAATYQRSLAASLGLDGAVTRLGKFRRRVLSKRILLEDGLDLLLEGGGKVFMEAQKVLSFTGTLTRRVGLLAYTLSGVLGLAGSLSRWQRIAKSLSGAITPSGALSRFSHWVRFGGGGLSLDATGSPRYYARRLLSAVISAAGAVSRKGIFARSASGALSFAGKLRKRLMVTVGGALSFAGSAAAQAAFKYYRALAGAMSFTATIARTGKVKRTISGAISPAANLLWELGAKIYGVLTFAGTLARKVIFYRSEGGTLTSTATATKSRLFAVRALAGVLNFRGLARRVTQFVKKGLSRLGFNFDED